jgi:hypothetical protein
LRREKIVEDGGRLSVPPRHRGARRTIDPWESRRADARTKHGKEVFYFWNAAILEGGAADSTGEAVK